MAYRYPPRAVHREQHWICTTRVLPRMTAAGLLHQDAALDDGTDAVEVITAPEWAHLLCAVARARGATSHPSLYPEVQADLDFLDHLGLRIAQDPHLPEALCLVWEQALHGSSSIHTNPPPPDVLWDWLRSIPHTPRSPHT